MPYSCIGTYVAKKFYRKKFVDKLRKYQKYNVLILMVCMRIKIFEDTQKFQKLLVLQKFLVHIHSY